MMMFFIRVVLVDYETMNLKSKSCCNQDFNNDEFPLIVVSTRNYLDGFMMIAVYKPVLSCDSSAPKA
jgi:hypothetical protein